MKVLSKKQASQRKAAVQSQEDKTGKASGVTVLSLPSKEFLFTQNTICCSVSLENGSHLIKSASSDYVNNNGETWSNESLKANYKSFIGAWNYLDHIQIPAKSIGVIPDAVLRKIALPTSPKDFIYYVDILVATHRANEKICREIATGGIEYLSMGCNVHVSTCSKCGHVMDFSEEDETYLGFEEETSVECEHMLLHKGKIFTDARGQKRKCAEILGTSQEGTVDFFEASFLTKPPAFHGAVKRNVLSIDKDSVVSVEYPTDKLDKPAAEKYLSPFT